MYKKISIRLTMCWWVSSLLLPFNFFDCIIMTFHAPEALRMLTSTFSSVLGAIILISIVLPWFLIGVLSVLLICVYAAAFYRSSARELTVPFYHLNGFCRPDPTIFFFPSQRLGRGSSMFPHSGCPKSIDPFR